LIGIANELFEYNKFWQSSVLFLFFFIVSTISINLMTKPNAQFSNSNTEKAIGIISEHLGVSDENQARVKSLVDKAKEKFKGIKENKKTINKQEVPVSSQFDQTTVKPQNQDKPKPTTLDTLNEN
jgi:hypothetical protein